MIAEAQQTIVESLSRLWQPDCVYELRCPKTKNAVVSGYFNNLDAFAAAAADWTRKAEGVYCTINPVNPELLARSANRVSTYARNLTGDKDITRRAWIPLDFDPKRPAGISSTDAEHALAIKRANEAGAWLISVGLPRSSIIGGDSGNGAHLLVRVDLPNDDEATRLVRRFIEAVASKFSDNVVDVDQTSSNASRIWKVYGTWSRKGDSTEDRPHRQALMMLPEYAITVPSTAVIAHVANLAPPPDPSPGKRGIAGEFKIDAFMAEHFRDASELPWQNGRKWVLSVCPFNPEHTDRSAVIIEHASGALSFKCHHNGCYHRSWTDVRQQCDPDAYRREGRAIPGTAPLEPPNPPSATNGHVSTAGLALSQLGNAERLQRLHGDDVRHVETWKRWLVWDGARFRRDDTQRLNQLAIDTVRSIAREAAGEENEDTVKAILKHALRSESFNALAGAAALASALPGIAARAENFDAAPMLFNCANGTLDLRTGELRPHKRLDLLTIAAPVIFDPAARCPLWLACLETWMAGDAELIDYCRRAAGYSMTGMTSEEVFFFLYGSGRNGKTKYVRAIQDTLGDYARSTRPETILSKRYEGIPNDIAALVGVRFVPTSEVDDGARLAEGLVKQLTGGDVISTRFMRGEFFDFVPQLKLWIVANHKPVIRGTEAAIWERIHLIPFTVTIPPEQRDPHLAEKLKAEASGILNWMLAGCLEWQRIGLSPPRSVRDAVAMYRDEMDVLGMFLKDACVEREDAFVSSSALYEAYSAWCEAMGEKQMTAQRLGRVLHERGFEDERHTKTRIWNGLDLLPGREGGTS